MFKKGFLTPFPKVTYEIGIMGVISVPLNLPKNSGEVPQGQYFMTSLFRAWTVLLPSDFLIIFFFSFVMHFFKERALK